MQSRTLIRDGRECCRRLRGAAMLAVFVTCVAAFSAPAQQHGESCTVMRQTGPVTILRGGRDDRSTIGTVISADDQIVTGRNARLRLNCSGGIDATIGANSSLSVQQLTEADQSRKAVLVLLEGILRITLAPSANRNSFELRTPTAVAAARSTIWTTEVLPAGTSVFVVEGTVSVNSRQSGASVLLEPGFGTDVAPNAAPTQPVRWGQARVESALRRTEAP